MKNMTKDEFTEHLKGLGLDAVLEEGTVIVNVENNQVTKVFAVVNKEAERCGYDMSRGYRVVDRNAGE